MEARRGGQASRGKAPVKRRMVASRSRRLSPQNVIFNFMKAGRNPRGPPGTVAKVTALLKHSRGVWARKPTWNGSYWAGRADLSRVTVAGYQSLLRAFDSHRVGAHIGPIAYLPR